MFFELLQGDITTLKVDVVVNAASTSLGMGGGVALAIKNAGGKEIEDEVLKKAPIDLGNAIATNAGKLSAKIVIHSATMHLNSFASAKSIRDCVKNSLSMADSLGMKSIAFPALGCGIGKYPKRSCAKIIFREMREFKAKNLEKAFLILYSQRDFELFREIMQKNL